MYVYNLDCYTAPVSVHLIFSSDALLSSLAVWGNTVGLFMLSISSVSTVSACCCSCCCSCCCCCCCCQPRKSMRLWRRLGKSVMLKIWSTAVTHTAASQPQPHWPYWLILLCVWDGGGQLYRDLWHWHCCPLIKWPHLTLYSQIQMYITLLASYILSDASI